MLRAKMRKKKPKFVRQDIHKKSKLSKKWRKPKGWHAKMRLGFRGKIKAISTGYGVPKKVRNLTKEGLRTILINSKQELVKIKNKEEAIIISSKVGNKKRIDIIQEAQKNEIKIVNIKDIDAFLKKIEEMTKLKKELRKRKQETKKEKEKKETKKEKKEDLAAKVSDEEKKEQEKKEKDKLLIKRDVK